jgi:dolichyl-phosphate beta-glucosyltransferase
MFKPDISLIIPAYNEAERIGKSLLSAQNYLKDNFETYEIVVVDDGSTDGTANLARNYGDSVKVFQLERNSGKGAAVRKGMLESSGRIRVFSDADFSTPIYELKKIIGELESGADICIGSRAIQPELIKVHQPFFRELLGKTFNLFVRTILFSGIKDTQCGFKGFKDYAAEQVFSKAKIDGFGFDVEILYIAKKENFRIKQVPVEWFNDDRTTVSPVKGLKAFFELFEIKRLHK